MTELTRPNAIERGSAPLTYTQSKYLKHAKVYSPYENPRACLKKVAFGSDACPTKGPAVNSNQEVCPKKGPAGLNHEDLMTVTRSASLLSWNFNLGYHKAPPYSLCPGLSIDTLFHHSYILL